MNSSVMDSVVVEPAAEAVAVESPHSLATVALELAAAFAFLNRFVDVGLSNV